METGPGVETGLGGSFLLNTNKDPQKHHQSWSGVSSLGRQRPPVVVATLFVVSHPPWPEPHTGEPDRTCPESLAIVRDE